MRVRRGSEGGGSTLFIRNKAMFWAGVSGLVFSFTSGFYMLFKTGQVGSDLAFQVPYSVFCSVFFWLSYKVGVSTGVRVESRGFSVRNLFKTVDVGYGRIDEVRLQGRVFLVTDRGNVGMFAFSPSLYGDLTKNRSYIPVVQVLRSALERGKSTPFGGVSFYRERYNFNPLVLIASFAIFFAASLIFDVG